MRFYRLKRPVDWVRHLIWTRIWGMTVHPSARISLSAKLDKTHPKGIVIRERSYVTFGAVILTHDRTRKLRLTTVIEPDCFIGINSIILPGVRIGQMPSSLPARSSRRTSTREPSSPATRPALSSRASISALTAHYARRSSTRA